MRDTVYILFEEEPIAVYATAELAEEALLRAEARDPATYFWVESYGVIS